MILLNKFNKNIVKNKNVKILNHLSTLKVNNQDLMANKLLSRNKFPDQDHIMMESKIIGIKELIIYCLQIFEWVYN
jgi:hypothetical protein